MLIGTSLIQIEVGEKLIKYVGTYILEHLTTYCFLISPYFNYQHFNFVKIFFYVYFYLIVFRIKIVPT